MYKVGVCGHFAFGDEQFNSGQKDKTVSVYTALVKKLGKNAISTVDTRGWKKNPLKLVFQCNKLLKNCENIIMLPATNGLKVFPRLFELLNVFYKRKLHYVVVGGWLAGFIKNNPALIPSLKKLDTIQVEIPSMQADLKAIGFTNVCVLPNFRETVILTHEELCIPDSEPYRFCTFSRIRYEKGIEDAIEAVRYVNNTLGRTACTLDIYGLPDEEYIERFEKIQKTFEPFITYKGFVSGAEAASHELRSCFAMLLPTRFSYEGFPGTVVDAFCAGLPIITTSWTYSSSAVTNGENGIIYTLGNNDELKEILLYAVQNPDVLNQMRKNSLSRAYEFTSEHGVNILLERLGLSVQPEETL